jgi:Tol biopolymer transport system component
MTKKLNLVVVLLFFSITLVSNLQAQKRPKFSEWTPAERLAAPINSEFNDQAPVLSKDEKTLFFTSTRPNGGFGDEDIWVSTRQTRNSPWKTPVNLGPTINTPGKERLRSLTADGRVMLFMSDRTGGTGSTDIWATVRLQANDDTSWSEPVNLGSNINTANAELAARYLLTDSGHVQKLFFSSERLGGFGGSDIYQSNITGSGFEPAVNVFELNSASVETCFWVRDDGLEIIFVSNRPELTGNLAYNDLWVSTRDSIYENWSSPVKLGTAVNSDSQEVNPSLSADGRTMLFASRRPGGLGPGTLDIYISTRRRVAE